MVEKSPFFRPSSNHRVIVVQERTPGGKHTRKVQKEDSEHKSGLVGTAANLVNAIVGCGIVGIPFAIRQAGFVAGLFLIVFVAAVTEKSLRLLVNTAKHVHVPTYETLAEACFGVIGFRFIIINMAITSYGAMVSYLMLVKDSFGTLFLQHFYKVSDEESNPEDVEKDELVLRRTILLVISLAVMLPLSCKRDMADLAQTSRVNVLIDVVLVALVAYNAPFAEAFARAATRTDVNWFLHVDTVFIGLGVLSFAFVCQHAAFIIAGSLDNPTSKRWSMVSGGALTTSAVLALCCGLSGFLGFRERTKGNILDNLDEGSTSANVARAMIGVALMFVYPLENHVFRHCSLVLLFKGRAAHEGEDSLILARRDRRVILTTAIYILSIIPALLAEDLGPVLAITGAIGGSSLSYLGPGLVYLGIHGERFLELVRESWGSSSHESSEAEKDTSENISGQEPEKTEEGMVVLPGTSKRPDLAVETTPLVSNDRQPQSGEEDDLLPVIDGFFKKIAWYVLLMPFWCWIAKKGMKRLEDHVHEMTLKSPHPIRIGDVQYKKVIVNTSGQASLSTQFQKMAKDGSFTNLTLKKQVSDMGGGSQSIQSINQQIGKELLEKQQNKKKETPQDLEPDPQAAPPSWLDFYIAIFFVLLGLVALFAGLFSLSANQASM